MSDTESERPGGTQPGLKKNDLLTRQTGDGSFEFIVEPASGDAYAYEAEASVGSSQPDAPAPSDTHRVKRLALIGVGLVLLVVAIGVSLSFGKSKDSKAGREDSATAEHEVAGFKPYGGGEPAPRAERPAASQSPRARQAAAVPVEVPQENFVEEAVEEPVNALTEPETQPEPDWAVGESEEYVQEEEENTPGRIIRSMPRDRVNIQQLSPRGIQTERLRNITEREGRRVLSSDRIGARRIQNLRSRQEAEESAENESAYEVEEQVLEEDFQEPAMEEEYFEEEYEEEFEEENY